ncbi:MAG: uracil phosphoribosyltransferase [Flavobacteriaceae bacterium CG_4_8_14_3_um_filter_34_10]|nr:uracil phosphoribosyltransferase [Flavobacteriia bacterium]OIP51426.1 MAG: uracil phosphoribosyltransferase [Flavobacteriaceae bacterium CG2_30_34_30]PIQ17906.1 MAG: uracil phosphoribosyltransferase [Flavobacteriaceae bacterium CG18_big_fil_WC_8_21_14_2_50_34_36]PIV51818.1 MAG: uracil phosphoribosyltransferase [Flavobacteriaceae bacterium CG02_land_8_20_14_3_00_34_13]PIX09633.1 MAG: uracil phosphoribosyltransferase [Flavobacteriaceae bacterium CG_4_8_14_3_um_filter_34_10]PIZ08917.1 MAG: ura
MHLVNLQEQHTIVNAFIAQLRDVNIQKDGMRFRKNIERIGEMLGFELSKSLVYKTKSIATPLGKSSVALPEDHIVICSILRAGLPLHTGLLNVFDGAENSFISAFRHHTSETEFEIKVEYLATPSLEGKTLIIADPMLATGRTFMNVLEALKPMGRPKCIHLVSVIGSKPGIDFLQKSVSKDVRLWIAAVDNTLNEYGYIVPGLGDAGDLCFGNKLSH